MRLIEWFPVTNIAWLNCPTNLQNQIGWREQSRKMLLFSTDAGFHFAGDGKVSKIGASGRSFILSSLCYK